MASFDVAAARAAGYSDADIVEHLTATRKFDAPKARAAGYTDADIIGHLTSTAPKAAIPAAPASPAKAPSLTPEDTPGVGETLMIGAGRTFDKVLDGATQMFLNLKGDKKALEGLKQNADEKTRLYAPLQEARPGATAIGEALPSLVVPGVGTTGTIGATALKLGAAGAIPKALEYGTVGERARGAAEGAIGSVVGGVVVPAVANAVGGAVKNGARSLVGQVSPEVAALAKLAEKHGIPINAAQLGDSKFAKTLSSVVERMPFTGGTQNRQVQQEMFNRAVSRTFGEDAPKVTRDVYDAARRRLGSEFDRLSSQNELKVTPKLMQEVNDVIGESARYSDKETARAILNIATDLRAKLDTGTMTIPGQGYQAMDSKISQLLSGNGNGEKTAYLKRLQEAIRSGMDDSISVADQEAWQTARSQYRNLKTVRDIVAKEGADGNISPALLMGRINASGSAKEQMARGRRGELGDLAQVGKQFLVDKVPDSGTAQRSMVQNMLGVGTGVAGIAAAPALTVGMITSGLTAGRGINTLLNSPKVHDIMMGPQGPAIRELIKNNPSKITQILGQAAGMTVADLVNQ